MITNIKINGFKSFHNFEMNFTPFTVIAGANASGKSNLFDALKLLSQLAETDNLKKAFNEQRGEFIELFTQYDNDNYATEMSFTVEMLVNKKVVDSWKQEANVKYTRLRYSLKIRRFQNNFGVEELKVIHEHLETINHQGDNWLKNFGENYLRTWLPKVRTGKSIPYMETKEKDGKTVVIVRDDGTKETRQFPLMYASKTVLSVFNIIEFPHFLAAQQEMKSWKFLELNPNDLRKPTHKEQGSDVITSSGKNLAAALYRIKQLDEYALVEISRRLQEFLPHFVKVDVIDDDANKQFLIRLTDDKGKTYSSRVLSEGTLRLLALCIFEFDEKYNGLLCFEEPENGVHPFRIKAMIELLRDLSVDFSDKNMPLRQVIVNTHSPIVIGNLSQWSDDVNTSIWYARIVNRITKINGIPNNLSVTKIVPVYNENHKQLSVGFSEAEQKFTLATVENYLKIVDFQTT